MQSPCSVRIDAPDLLMAVFVATGDRQTQAELALSSRAWAAVSRGCRRLTARFDLDADARAFKHRKQLEAQQVAPAGDLAGLASWLCQQQQAQQQAGGLIHCLDLGIADECCLRLRPGGSLLAGTEARHLAQARACQAVTALSGTLEHLQLTTGVDASWLPPLPYLTRLELCFARLRRPHRFAEGKDAQLAWLSQPQRLPRLRELKLQTSFHQAARDSDPLDWEAPRLGRALPPALTRLEIESALCSFCHAGQLHSLDWAPGEYGWPWNMTRAAWNSICQATQLTRLHLEGFCPYDARQFFGHLARATGLRSLELDGWADVGTPSFLSSAVIPDARERQGLLASLGAALEALTALTSLTLNNLKLAACLGAPSGGLAVLPCLAELDVSLNSFDPAGSMRALPLGPYQSSLRTLVVDGSVVAAALAQPDQALWGMPGLTRIELWWSDMDDEIESNKQLEARIDDLAAALYQRLPQLENMIVK